MDIQEIAKKLKGLHTIETIAEKLNIETTSAENIVVKLKKAGFLQKTGGGSQKRLYKISPKKISKENGMFTILNKYAKEKIVPPFKHYVHGKYTIEDAITDLIKINKTRINISLLPLFNHVKNWYRLYNLAKEKKISRNLGLLYDIARLNMKARKMPDNIYNKLLKSNEKINYKSNAFRRLAKKWRIKAPFSEEDLK